MRTGRTLGAAAMALLASWPAAAIAQDNVVANVTAAPAPPQEPVPDSEPLPVERPAPSPDASEPIVTTVPVAVPTAEPLPELPPNPYANSYNEFLPLEENEEEGFPWGLLGLLGLVGLFGLAGRRERVVYVERADREVAAPRTGDRIP